MDKQAFLDRYTRHLNDKQLADKERAVLRNGDHIKLANEELIFLMR